MCFTFDICVFDSCFVAKDHFKKFHILTFFPTKVCPNIDLVILIDFDSIEWSAQMAVFPVWFVQNIVAPMIILTLDIRTVFLQCCWYNK